MVKPITEEDQLAHDTAKAILEGTIPDYTIRGFVMYRINLSVAIFDIEDEEWWKYIGHEATIQDALDRIYRDHLDRR